MATATMGVSSVDRLARSKRPTVERTEIHIPPAPTFPVEAVTGDPRMRVQAVAAFNNALQKWRNDAWSIEAPFVPDAELQSDVSKLEDTTAKLITKLDRAAVDIRRAEANITTISTNVTNIDNSITTIDNRITIVESNSITGTGIVQANGTNPPTAILGSTGHFPYWQPTDPHLSATSPIYLSAGFIGIGTVGPATELDVVGVVNASTGFRVNNLAVAGTVLRSNGTNYIGGQVVLTTDVTGLLPTVSGGTNHGNYTAGSVIFAGAGGTSLTEDNANLFWDDANNRLGVGTAAPTGQLHVWRSSTGTTAATSEDNIVIEENGSSGLTIFGATTESIRFGFAAQPFDGALVYRNATRRMDFLAANSTIMTIEGTLRNLGVGELAPLYRIYGYIADAVTTVTDVLGLNHSISGTPAANFGTGILLTGKSSTTDKSDMARIQTIWTDSTHATRTSALQFQTVNSAAALATAVTITGAGNVGIGVTSPSAKLDVIRTITSTVSQIGVQLILDQTVASGTPESFTQLNYLYLRPGVAVVADKGFGASFRVFNAGVGTITNLVGAEAILNISSTGTVVNAYGFKVSTLANAAGTITNTYGVWVGDITVGTQSNVAYSFYASDTSARNYFAGNTGMGGGLSVGDGGTTMTLGVVNATVGYRIANAAASGAYLRGNGTNFIGSALLPSDITYAFTEGSVLFAGPGGTTIAQDNANFFWDNTNNFLGLGTAVPLVLLHLNTAGFNDTSILFENANGYAAIELDGPTGDFKVSSLFGELQFVAGNQVHLSMDGVGNTLVVSGLGTISGYFSATGNVGIGTNATAPGALLDIGLAGTTLGVMRLAGSTSGNVTIQAQAIAGTWTLQLPANDGNNLDVLQTDGSGVTSWVAPTSIATPVSIANGGTNATSYGLTNGLVFYDGTRFLSSASATEFIEYTSQLWLTVQRSIDNLPVMFDMRNPDTTASTNAGVQLIASMARTTGAIVTSGSIVFGKESIWTAVDGTVNGYIDIETVLGFVRSTALSILSSGSIVCGKNSTSNTRIDDFLYIPSSAGNPSGTADEYGSRCPLAYDTTNNELFVYNPTDNTWRSVVLT